MYDRKTWIILAICGVLIALNIHYSSKNRAAQLAEEAKNAPTETPVETISDEEAPAGLTVENLPPPTEEELLVLENDHVTFTFSNIGGGIKFAELKKQRNVGKTSLVRINRNGSGPIAGLVGSNETLENASYSYNKDKSEADKSIVYTATLNSGLVVEKVFSLETTDIPGADYFVNLSLTFTNPTTATANLSQYDLYLGKAAPLYEKERPTYTGFFWHNEGKMHFTAANKFKGGWFGSESSILDSEDSQDIEYAGVTDQFFTTVIRPETSADTRVWGKPSTFTFTPGGKSHTGVRAAISLPSTDLAADNTATLNYRIFTGPKANTMLRELDGAKGTGEGWGDMMQYGFFSPVSRFLNWVLNHLHTAIDHLSTTQSWGLAIICLTILVRAAIWPLHAKSTRSMKRMSKLQPKMKELKEKYADDPNKLNTEMMGMYRKYGINPIGGCLPMFIQIPIFFGFFRMLDYAVELRNQPFLWVDDLSQPDTLTHLAGIPINILPIVMAATSVIQMSLMPKTGDKMQQRIMMFMPLMFFFFCYNYASALALYWTTQNIFSIGQTYLMNKIPEPELKARKDGGKKSWVQRMAEKQAELQKGKGDMRNVTPGTKPKKKGPPRTGG
ncbi:MAG: membrane protein insertase YidC [Luteolibacter sp.]